MTSNNILNVSQMSFSTTTAATYLDHKPKPSIIQNKRCIEQNKLQIFPLPIHLQRVDLENDAVLLAVLTDSQSKLGGNGFSIAVRQTNNMWVRHVPHFLIYLDV